MRRFLMIGVCASMAMFVATHARAADGSTRPPNIVILLADDLGYGDLGFQGGKDIPTPHVDSLAANGVRFANGYVSGPYCSPTRAGLLTGRYQTRFGYEFNPGRENGLPKSETTIADRLKAAGYATGLVGKWHLGAELRPLKRVRQFFGFHGGAHVYFAEQSRAIFSRRVSVVEKEYLTDALLARRWPTSTAIKRIRSSSTWPSRRTRQCTRPTTVEAVCVDPGRTATLTRPY